MVLSLVSADSLRTGREEVASVFHWPMPVITVGKYQLSSHVNDVPEWAKFNRNRSPCLIWQGGYECWEEWWDGIISTFFHPPKLRESYICIKRLHSDWNWAKSVRGEICSHSTNCWQCTALVEHWLQLNNTLQYVSETSEARNGPQTNRASIHIWSALPGFIVWSEFHEQCVFRCLFS